MEKENRGENQSGSPNRLSTRAKGNRGEERAISYLLSLGYAVICRNYRSRKGEIDCIARAPDGTLVFVEVKSSVSSSCGHPFFRITPAKQRTIGRIARQYIAEHHLSGMPCRIDVIAVTDDKIDHIRNAFLVS